MAGYSFDSATINYGTWNKSLLLFMIRYGPSNTVFQYNSSKYNCQSNYKDEMEIRLYFGGLQPWIIKKKDYKILKFKKKI